MTVFFTKTCARDWERCGYQAIAIDRLFPLAKHVILIEVAEFEKAHEMQGAAGNLFVRLLAGKPQPSERSSFDPEVAENFCGKILQNARFMFVERSMPEAMRIENPDIRQQYCKLRAPVILGEDTIQIDSDMCPKPVQTRWMDHLYTALDAADGRPRWHAPEASKAMQPAVENWAKTYKQLFGADPATSAGRDFMRSQFGWYVPRNAARDFLVALGPDPIATILGVVDKRLKFSEYQLLGMWACDLGYRIRFQPHAEQDPWLMHFSSKDALEPEQRKLLRQAAGLED